MPTRVANDILTQPCKPLFIINPHPRKRGPCGPRKTLSGAYSAIMLQRSLGLHIYLTTLLSFGVRADPADYKLVSFFVTADEG